MMRKKSRNGVNAKGIGSFLALLSFTAYMPISCMQAFANDMVGVNTLPEINKAVNGEVSTSGNVMNVSVNGGTGTVGQFDWNTFNVGRNAQVNWIFNANSQTALNRVLASGGMSYIYGKLTESSGNNCPDCVNTSKVILINPSGIMFGNGSSVNLNSFTASTFDIKGAKDLKDLSDAELKAYAGKITKESGENGGLFNIAGYNKSIEFVANDNMVNGNGYVVADATGTRLASIVADGAHFYGSQNVKTGDTTATVNNKTVAIIGNKIDVNNSKIETAYESKPNAANYQQTKSNVRLVTGDGVNFYYTSNGNIESGTEKFNAATKKSNKEEQGISIANSEIRTGDFYAHNGVADNGSIKVNNSKIYTKKLLGKTYGSYKAEQTGTNGNLKLESKGTISITNSDIQTTNDKKDGKLISTGVQYGHLLVSGDKGVKITDSQVRTADSTGNSGAAGRIQIVSKEGNVSIIQDKGNNTDNYDNTGIVSAGDMKIAAGKNVTINGYDKIQAQGIKEISGDTTGRNLIVSGNNVTYKNTTLAAKNINTSAAEKITVQKTNVLAKDNVVLLAKNTVIDGSDLQYKNLKFYDDNTTNNVTIRSNSTFDNTNETATGLELETNGNLTLDKATLKKRTENSTANQKAISLKSTKNSVTIQNESNIESKGTVAINAGKAVTVKGKSNVLSNDENTIINAKNNVTVDDSVVYAKSGNVNVTSTNGKITAKSSSKDSIAKIFAEGDADNKNGGAANLTQKLAMDLSNDFGNSLVGGTAKLTLKSDGNITADTLQAGKITVNTHKDIPTLADTSKNAVFTLGQRGGDINSGKTIKVNDLKSANKVNLTAQTIDIKGKNNTTLTSVTTNVKGTTKISSNGDLKINNLEIKGGKATTLEGKTITTPSGKKITANNNKVALNSIGDINVNVSGISNPDNGLEVNAEINTGVKDNNRYGQDALKGRNVTINAGNEDLAVSKIKADTLTLKAKNILKGKTTVTNELDNLGNVQADGTLKQSINTNKTNAGRGYIEVRTEGGFNLDPTDTYNDSNKNIYTGSNITSSTTTKTEKVGDQYDKVTNTSTDSKTEKNSELISSKTVKDKEISRKEASRKPVGEEKVVGEPTTEIAPVYDENGKVIANKITTTETLEQDYEVTDNVKYSTKTTNTYRDTETTTTKTTNEITTYQNYKTTVDKKQKQHVATLNENEKDGFVLVYGKNVQGPTTNTAKVIDVKTDTKTDTKTVVTNEARKVVTDGDPITEKVKRTETKTRIVPRETIIDCELEEDIPINDNNNNDDWNW